MAVKFKRGPNGSTAKGLMILKNFKMYDIYHANSMRRIFRNNSFKTRKEAVAVIEKLLSLNINWELPFDDIRNAMQACSSEILGCLK